MTRTRTARMTRLGAAAAAAVFALGVAASTTLAGEITGNGKLKVVNGHSPCAYSGQEDLQWYQDDGDTILRSDPTRGDPSHSQSWGQIDKATRDFLTSIGLNPGIACNPTRSTFGE
jgi:hypothetical protein